jgi:hypothetical protein
MEFMRHGLPFFVGTACAAFAAALLLAKGRA